MSQQSAAPPAQPRPVHVAAGGVEWVDPYAWMEEDSAESLAWQAAHNAAAERRLRDVAGFDALRRSLDLHVGATFVSAPHGRGDRWLRFAYAGGERLEVAAGPAGPWRAILAVETFSEPGRAASFDWFFPSPDGRYVAFGVSWGGDEQCVLRLLDVEREEVLPIAVPDTWNSRVAWLPDSRGFFFPAGPYVMDRPRDLLFVAVGDEEPRRESLAALAIAQSSNPEPLGGLPQVSADGRWLTLSSPRSGGRIVLARRLPDGPWIEVLEDQTDTRAYGFVDGDDYVAVTSEDAPRGRLVRFPLQAAHDRSTWVELLPESDEVLVSVDLVAGCYVVCSLVDAAARVRVMDRQGRPVAEVPLPARGVVAEQAFSGSYKIFPPIEGGSVVACGDAFTFTFASPERSPATYLYDVPSRLLTLLEPPAFALEGVAAEARTAVGAEGREAHYTLVAPRDEGGSQPRPTLIYGYGGFNVAFVPSYLGKLAPFLLAGGVVVIAHLGGGGEYGEHQWHEGRLSRKQGTFDDLFLIAEALIAEGVTTPAQLGFVGESNGGLVAAAALVQRPELWGAVCVQVPVTDLLRSERDAYTHAAVVVEYGDASSPAEAPLLATWSPYQNVRDAAYPSTLVWTGENDVRCAPWHSRKFAARLLAANRSAHPVLLRARPDGGHLSVGTDPDQVAEWLGFLMRELGLPLPGPDDVEPSTPGEER
jgi:prolyl oligopeptidase